MDLTPNPERLQPSEFSLAIEQLCSLLSAIVIISHAPLRINQAFRSHRYASVGGIFWLKLAVVGIWSALQINIVFQWWHIFPTEARLPRAAALAAYISMPSLALIVCLGHLYSARQTLFLSGLLGATLLSDVTAFRTYFYREEMDATDSPHWAFVAIKLILLVLEQLPKQSSLGLERSSDTQDHRSHIFYLERTPLWRLTKFYFLFGFFPQLENEQASNIGNDANAEILYDDISLQWNKAQAKKKSRFGLLKVCLYCKADAFYESLIPHLIASGFTLAKPFVTRDILIALSTSDVSAELSSRLTKVTAVIYFGSMVSVTWSGYERTKLQQSLQTMLSATAYNKSLVLKAADFDAAAFDSIMDSEISKVIDVLLYCIRDWSLLVEVVGCLICLSSFSGAATVLSLVSTIVAARVLIDMHSRGLTDRKEWRRSAEEHVAFVSNIMAQLREIKMLGLGSALSKIMKRFHENEIRTSLQVLMAEASCIPAGAFVETSTPLVIVGAALFMPTAFVPSNIADFAVLAGAAHIIADVLGTLLRGLPWRLRGFDACKRLQEFISMDNHQDPRVYAPERLLGVELPDNSSAQGERRGGRNPRQQPLSAFVIQFVNVSVAFNGADPVLDDVSVRIPRGKVTMITGAIGTGKSTFLRSMIGRVQLSCGSLLVASTRVAYCAERPWIKNLTIRDNIVGENPFDRVWLDLVIYVCALGVDLARLPDGELTMAGSDGCNLSGGQKQRIAFARALYAKMDIIVVDDIFAVLDKHTSSAIRVRLFGETDILTNNNMTLIMSTSLKQHCVDADLVLEISREGHVRERSLASRDASPSYNPSEPGAARQVSSEEGVDAEEVDAFAPDPTPHRQLPASYFTILDASGGKLSDFSLYNFFYLGPVGGVVSSMFLSVVSTAAFAELVPVIFLYFWIATDAEDAGNLLIYAGFCLANPIFNHFTTLTSIYLVYPRTARALYAKVSETIYRATLDHLSSTDTNILINKFTQDVFKATDSLPLLLVPLVWAIVSVAIYVVSFYWISSSIIFPMFLAACQLGVSLVYRRAAHNAESLCGPPQKKLLNLLTDTSDGFEHIYAFQWQDTYLEKLYSLLDDIRTLHHQALYLNLWGYTMGSFVSALAAIGITWFALSSPEPTSQLAVGFAFFALGSLSFQIHTLSITMGSSDSALDSAHHLRSFIYSTPQEIDPETYEDVPMDWPQRGKIELSCVTAQYRPVGGSRHTALDHVSFVIQPGHIVGVSGRTGSGKTSLFMAMLNFMEFEGSISIDNREIRGLPRDILRSRITTMTQSGLELKGSVRLNINPFDPALRPRPISVTDDMLIGILRRVGLWSRIEARGGLDAPFSRMKFSSGQKQLFQLARAMLHRQMMRTKIILIDEGAPNAEIENLMRQVIREAFAGCTVLMVSHRPSLFREADRILTVDKGKANLYEHDRQQGRWSANRWNRR